MRKKVEGSRGGEWRGDEERWGWKERGLEEWARCKGGSKVTD